MNSIWKTTSAAALTALLALTAAGCGDKTATKQDRELLKIGVNASGDSLETTENYCGWQVSRYGVGECLTRFDGQMAVRPWLAESWKVSDDRLSWTFKVKDNIMFSNGNKMTAEAVKMSLERTFAMAKRARALFEPESFAANGQELTVRTKKPCAILPGLLGDPLFIIVDVTEEGKRDFARLGPVCTGPYMVTGFSKTKCELAVNPTSRVAKVPYKRMEVNIIDDPHTRAMALRKGKIDIAVNVGAGDLQLFKDQNEFNISEVASVRSVLVRLNQNKGKPLSDKRVRRALIQALDRDSYCKVLLKDTFIPGAPLLPSSADYGFDELMKQNPDRFHIENARKLLAEAGWKDTNRDGYVDKDGKNLELNFVFYSGRPELPLFAEATQSDAKQIGIKVNLKHVDYNDMYRIGTAGDYDMLISNSLALSSGDPEVFLNSYFRTNHSGDTPENASGYSNPDYDTLSARLAGEFDSVKRRDIVIKMQKILMDDAGTFVYGYPRINMISRKGVEGARIFPIDFYWPMGKIKPVE